MSEPGAKEKSRPPTGATGPSRSSSVAHKSKIKKDNVDLKSKEEEYRFLATNRWAFSINCELQAP